jgi:hypothetical protein
MNAFGRIFLLAVFVLGGLNAQALASGNVPAEDDAFPENLRTLFRDIDERYAAEATLLTDTLEYLWRDEYLSKSRRDSITEGVALLQRNRFRPWPDIGFYLKTVVATAPRPNPPKLFTEWHQALAHTLQTQTSHRSLTFLERSALFFGEQVLFKSGSVRWKLSEGQWKFQYENQQPKIIVASGRLTGYAHKDSTVLHNTSGHAMLLNERWIGQGGRITWQRALLDPARVYALLNSYSLDFNMPSFQADSVMFYNLDFFQEPLEGRLTERILAEVKPGEAQFPQFESYRQVLDLRELFPGINYRGGFTMAGGRVLGSGTLNEPARVEFLRNDSLFITARAPSFSIRNDRIISDKATVSIYLDKDSIYHPELTLRYLHHELEISLIRDERGASRAPFFNSFHKMDMYCQAMFWNVDGNEMKFQMVRGIQSTGEAIFESHDYFNSSRYHRLQGMDEVNPLVRLSMFSRQVDTRSFPIADFARYLRRDVSVVKNELLQFSFLGFLSYDRERERVTLHERLFHYLAANAGNRDYDVVRIRSVAPVNAVVNTNNLDMKLYGVERIPLSDAKNVVIHPENNEVTMQGNRDIYFHGRIESGLFDFFGRDFFFEYDDFKINLVNTDSMSFRVRAFEPDSRGRYEFVRVETVLEGINGELLVDHPRNKSGRLPYARYPIFNSNNESFVYYDRDRIQEGIYSRDQVYFQIVPFTIDSLDHASTENIAFDGVFHSGGIFPEFFDYLTVQPDFSLGFNTNTPEEGFPVYGGVAWYHGPITMSYEGLTTNGQLKYLEADIKAYNLVMFPDSVKGVAETFSLAATSDPVGYPAVNTQMADLFLDPHENRMSVATRNDPMDFFNGLSRFVGEVNLAPYGLIAAGEMALNDATLVADDFRFGTMDFASDNSMMGIQSRTSANNAFAHFGYQARFDMENMKASFEPGDGESGIAFPSNHISGQHYSFTWDITRGFLDFASLANDRFPPWQSLTADEWLDVDFSGYELEFTQARKDGLKFFTSNLQMDAATNLLQANGVRLIRVADAAVFPHEQEVFIEEGAEIRGLSQARIIANTTDRFHHFYEAGVDILSGMRYDAYGLYDYIDETGQEQTLEFHQIGVSRQGHTVAHADVPHEQEFTLSPHFAFKGKVELAAADPVMIFDGYSRISVDCPMPEPLWFGFNAPVDPENIFIPIREDLRSDERDILALGIMMAGDSTHIYSGIFSERRHWSDVKIVSAEGYITYDHVSGEYRVSSREKLSDLNRHEDYLRINTRNCLVQGEGRVDLGSDLGQFGLTSFGTVTHDLRENTVDYDIVLGMDFFFTDDALGMMHQSISNNESLQLLNLNRQKMINFLKQELHPGEAEGVIAELSGGGMLRRVPQPMNQTLFFGDVRLRWNQASRAFISTGPLGISQVNSHQVNRYVNGFIELRKQRGGDVLTMIFQPLTAQGATLGREWFYYTYSRGVLQAISSIDDFNRTITGMRQRHRQMRVERGQEPFVFILSTERRPFDFYEHMMRIRQ